jgi:hypothetical protein
MTYTIRAIGGERDGKLITDARVVRPFGGRQNYSDITLKAAEAITFIDFGSELNKTTPLGFEGGDYVYFQFLNGDVQLPIITGFAKHPLDPQYEVPETIPLGQHLVEQFNGVKTKIDENGNFTWTKGLGTYSPVGFDLNAPTAPLVNEYVAIPGSEELFKLDVDGITQTVEFSTLLGMGATFSMSLDQIEITTSAGAKVTFDGLLDTITTTTVVGTEIEVSGSSDAIALKTALGTNIEINGLSDSLGLSTAAGANMSINGLSDQIDLACTAGSAFTLAPTQASLSLPTGTTLELGPTGASLLDPTGAGFKVENGLIALGGPAAELVDLIFQAFQALATQTAPGFGAPTSTVATFAQLSAQIALIKGSL